MNILSHQWGRSQPQDRVWAQVVGLPPSRAHKRLLMVFQAFIDDSYKPEGVYALAGHIASAEVWGRFSPRMGRTSAIRNAGNGRRLPF